MKKFKLGWDSNCGPSSPKMDAQDHLAAALPNILSLLEFDNYAKKYLQLILKVSPIVSI